MQLQIFVAVTLMISLPAQMRAQENLVPNPGFEVINECPNHFSLISAPDEPFTYCDSWLEPNKGSSDIYHACCTWPYTVSVPDNVIGHIPAARGNAYVGHAHQKGARCSTCYHEVQQSRSVGTGAGWQSESTEQMALHSVR